MSTRPSSASVSERFIGNRLTRVKALHHPSQIRDVDPGVALRGVQAT